MVSEDVKTEGKETKKKDEENETEPESQFVSKGSRAASGKILPKEEE